ncbi:MAG: MFS transporter [Culicoidibacterales bacterium]
MKTVLQNRNVLILITGQIISLFGSAIQRFALSLYLLDLTGSASVFATILALSMIPIVIFAPIAGMIADRANKRKVMISLDLVSAAVIFCYLLLISWHQDQVAVIALVMIILSAVSTIYQATVTASLPVLVNEEQLLTTNGLVYQVSSLANFIGPILAGVLYGFFGIKVILIINFISFFASALLECALQIPHRYSQQKQSIRKLFQTDMQASYRYLRQDQPIIFRMIGTAGLFNLFLVPLFSVGAPYIIKITFGFSSQVYGLAEGLIALGMIVGALVISLWPRMIAVTQVHRILFGISVLMLLMSGAIFGAERGMLVSWSLVIFTIGGMGIMLILGIANVITNTYVQVQTSREMLGKVSAFGAAFATVCIPLGQLLFGASLELFNHQVALLVAFFALATALVTIIVRQNSQAIKQQAKTKAE